MVTGAMLRALRALSHFFLSAVIRRRSISICIFIPLEPKAHRCKTVSQGHSRNDSWNGNVIFGHMTLELGRLNHQALLPEALYP